MLADSELLVMIWVENCWSRFWCYSIELSEFKQRLVLYQTFWVQVLLKFLVSDDELNKELVKSNAFMFFCSDSTEISGFYRAFWAQVLLSKFLRATRSYSFVLILPKFLVLNQDFSLEISGFYQAFWDQVLLSKFLSSTSELSCVTCFFISSTRQ